MLKAQEEARDNIHKNQLPHYARGNFAIETNGAYQYFSSRDEMERVLPEIDPTSRFFDAFSPLMIIDVREEHIKNPPPRPEPKK